MIEKLYSIAPNFIQNLFITLYNLKEYRRRMGGAYRTYLMTFKENNSLSLIELEQIQNEKLKQFITYVRENSKYYNQLFQVLDLDEIESKKDIQKLPILDKETLRSNINDFYTIPKENGIISKTGGTTGKSLEVIFTRDNMQERFAMLDNFRSRYVYKLGKRTAWFSGKSILTPRDIRKNRFWKTDYWYMVRYYSTFHIKEDYLNYYIEDLLRFKPEYIVGFPSNMLEIAKYGLKNNIQFSKGIVKAIFPTAETVTEDSRKTIEMFFNTGMYDQYASSEGAPFIFECSNNNLHLELQSGIFEVLDANNEPTSKGRLVTTSFTTYGTPLIRYDIGDTLELSDQVCTCGNNNPMVRQILGRIDDFVYSPENGRINLGNISNALKGTKGIVKFQVIQDELNELIIKVVVDKTYYNQHIEKIFIKNWRDRIGNSMKLELVIVDDIPVESSGKYRIVKNNIKHLID